MSRAPARLLAVALDAADGPLIMRWAREGRLPVLARLAREGSTARLRSAGETFPESVWPTIVTGLRLGSHGVYNWRMVPLGTYARRSAPNGGGTPFWRALREHEDGLGAVLVDVPYTAPVADDGVTEVIGWGQRGATLEASWPPELIRAVVREHGSYPEWAHLHHKRSSWGQRRLLRALERMTRVRTRLVTELLRDRDWSFCMACYSEPHDAGHEFHRHVEGGGWSRDRRPARGVENGLLRVYQEADRGLGHLIAAAGEPLRTLVFSGFGMRPNASGEELLARVLIGLGHQVPSPPPAGSRPLHVLRGRVPWSVRRLLHLRLSPPARERLMDRLWTEATDWSRSRAFAEGEPGVGLVRLNVRGRDPAGMVGPGAEYRDLCTEIRAELLSLRLPDSDAPAVETVLHRDEAFDGPATGGLPDLIVRWSSERPIDAVRHPRLGLIREAMRDVPYSEHTGEGFLVAAGPEIRRGVELDGDVADLAPTMLALMGVPVPAGMDGRPLPGLTDA